MASRRCLGALSRHLRAHLLPTAALENPQALILRSLDLTIRQRSSSNLKSTPGGFQWVTSIRLGGARYYSSRPTNSSDEDEEDDEDETEEDEEEDEEEEEEEDGDARASKCIVQRGKSEEEKIEEAAEIGYKVMGPLDSSDNPFKLYEPFFAVVQIGSHQFKVSNGDSIFTERLKYCEVNDKLVLNKVLMLGSRTETVIGRPVVPDAAVHAVVEEHALDAKVIIFKKKRRKNYRRTKGHRQELTKLRITDIQGIHKSENVMSAV
ncbi:50S ribosomal protein L21, mitochondrial [Canna indica]|uniref:Large ribosomal subunit protein bL21m n=1 Tax=Canna indica TaxID=4628 RepID=A0AAQ3JZI8_9LILI|nr:50S ribosomal protein L21, mitochondrial [Canna indica]